MDMELEARDISRKWVSRLGIGNTPSKYGILSLVLRFDELVLLNKGFLSLPLYVFVSKVSEFS